MKIWKAIFRISWTSLLILSVIGVLVFYIPKWNEYRDYQEKKAGVAAQIEEEEEAIKRLRSNQERFRTDPRFVERVARDHGLAYSNEVLFRFEAEDTPGAPGHAPAPRGR